MGMAPVFPITKNVVSMFGLVESECAAQINLDCSSAHTYVSVYIYQCFAKTGTVFGSAPPPLQNHTYYLRAPTVSVIAVQIQTTWWWELCVG